MPPSKLPTSLRWIVAGLAVWGLLIAVERVCQSSLVPLDVFAAHANRAVDPSVDRTFLFATSRWRNYVDSRLGSEVEVIGVGGGTPAVLTALMFAQTERATQRPVLLDLNVGRNRGYDYSKVVYGLMGRPDIVEALARDGWGHWYQRFPGLRFFGIFPEMFRRAVRIRGMGTLQTGFFERPPVKDSEGGIPALRIAYYGSESGEVGGGPGLARAVAERRRTGCGFNYTAEESRWFVQAVQALAPRKVAVIVSPLHGACWERFDGLEAWNALLAELRAEPNVILIDYSRDVLPDEDYADTTHLSGIGATRFSERVHRDLAERGLRL